MLFCVLATVMAGLCAAPARSGATQAWHANAAAFDAPAHIPLLAIVLDDLGMDRKRTRDAVMLPAPLTLAWLPHAPDLEARTRSARARGHELLVHLPMEPQGRADPGPGALLTSLDRATLRARIGRALDAFDGHVGVNNHMGSRFTAHAEGMRILFDSLSGRGLLFLDSLTTPDSVARALGARTGMAVVSRDIFLDARPGAGEVRAQLARAVRLAERTGSAIAIGHPRDHTIDTLRTWLSRPEERGRVRLAPLSAVARRRLGG